jgi:hypothetical protein
MQPQFEVADVLRKLGNRSKLGLNTWQLRTLSAIKRCRTAALEGILMLARTAGKLVSITAVAGTDIIPSVKAINKKNGFRLEPLNFARKFSCGFTLPDSLNSLAIHQPKLFTILLKLVGKRYNTLVRPKKYKQE